MDSLLFPVCYGKAVFFFCFLFSYLLRLLPPLCSRFFFLYSFSFSLLGRLSDIDFLFWESGWWRSFILYDVMQQTPTSPKTVSLTILLPFLNSFKSPTCALFSSVSFAFCIFSLRCQGRSLYDFPRPCNHNRSPTVSVSTSGRFCLCSVLFSLHRAGFSDFFKWQWSTIAPLRYPSFLGLLSFFRCQYV